MEANRVASVETTFKIQNEYSYVFTGIGCFKGTFSLQVKDAVKPYQAPPNCIAYAPHGAFKELG